MNNKSSTRDDTNNNKSSGKMNEMKAKKRNEKEK